MLKQLLMALVVSGVALSANALPFDAFEGSYTVVGKVAEDFDQASSISCGYGGLLSFTIETKIFKGVPTQFVSFQFKNGSLSTPITSDLYISDRSRTQNVEYYRAFATTDYAVLEQGLLNDQSLTMVNYRTTTTLAKNGPTFTLTVVEQFLSDRNVPVGVCRSQANLVR